jgi:heptosyltransferase III
LRWATRTRRRNGLRLSLLRLAAGALGPIASRPADQPRRVLLLRPDHIGDVLLTAPAVALLGASLPAMELTYVVGPWSVAAARRGPPVDRLRTLTYPGFTRRHAANVIAPYTLLLGEAIRLRRERYELAVIFRPDHWWGALLALVAGIPVRVGGDTPETRPLLTHTCDAPSGSHAAEQSLDLARLALRALRFQPQEPSNVVVYQVSNEARATADGLWSQHELEHRRVVAIHPSAGAPLKSWPVEHWAHLADGLTREGAAVVMVGAPGDGPVLARIVARMTNHAPVLCGQTLDVSAAIYQRSTAAVAVDSGAAHLAAAVGTPTVRLYGPAPADRFGPWPPRSDQRVLVTRALACVPCGHLEAPPCGARELPACMLALGVDEVLNAVRALLDHG